VKLLAGNAEDERPNPYPWPLETWELQELTVLGCPDEALKTFRKSLIGRGNPLTARQADAAIADGQGAIRTGRIPKNDKRGKRPLVPETFEQSLPRLAWYVRMGMSVVFARPQGHKWTEDELEIVTTARELECALTFLEWYEAVGESTAGVDRVAGPGAVVEAPDCQMEDG
jgi:hypothetical protein